jgi:hypothetical protein
MYQSVRVQRSELHRYQPGQEDWMCCVRSSVASDAGIDAVVREPKMDRGRYPVQEAAALARLWGFVRHWLATMPIKTVTRREGRLA